MTMRSVSEACRDRGSDDGAQRARAVGGGCTFSQTEQLSIHKLALAGRGGGAGGALAALAEGAARLVTEESERIERAMDRGRVGRWCRVIVVLNI